MSSTALPTPPSSSYVNVMSVASLHENASITMAASALSATSAAAAIIFYYRHRRTRLNNAINDALVVSFVFGLLGTLTMFVSALLAYVDYSALLSHFCEFSGVSFQLFHFPSFAAEGIFFLTIISELRNGAQNDRTFSRVGCAIVIALGALYAVVVLIALPPLPGRGSAKFAPTSDMGWCWMPDRTQGEPGYAVGIGLRSFFLLGAAFTLITGLVAVVLLAVNIQAFSRIVISRALYLVAFVWLQVTVSLPMAGIDTTFTHRMLALAPITQALNVVVFFVSEWKSSSIPQAGNEQAGGGESGGDMTSLALGTSFARIDTSYGIEEAIRGVHQRREHQRRFLNQVQLTIDPETDEFVLVLSEPTNGEGGGRGHDGDEAGSAQSLDTIPRDSEVDGAAARTRGPDGMPSQRDIGRSFVNVNQSFSYLAAPVIGASSQGPARIRIHVPQLEKPYLALSFCFLAGYCDCCGFLTLDLFTAHVTGNFATIGTSIKSHTDAVWLKVAGLVVFSMFVAIAQFLTKHVQYHARCLIGLQIALLLLSCVFAIVFTPFGSEAAKLSVGAYLTGLSMVAAMALQNAFQRMYLVGLPMTTLMTGNTTGFVIDLFNVSQPAARQRIKNNGLAIISFLVGCILVTVLVVYEPMWAYVPPPMIAIVVLALSWKETDAPAAASKSK